MFWSEMDPLSYIRATDVKMVIEAWGGLREFFSQSALVAKAQFTLAT